MFAVIMVGAKQYKVSEGDTILTDRFEDKDGKSITLDKVLMFAKGSDIRVGQPYLKDVKVTAKLTGNTLSKKVTSLKYRRRKDSSSKSGHRQKLSSLNITKISA